MQNLADTLAIVAPTASGKSELIAHLARLHPDRFEVISVDSVSIYREMDIGSAKPSLVERQQVKHHLIDILNPDDKFSVTEFIRLCEIAVKDIQQRGKIPLLVGGTMMYFHFLFFGISAVPKSSQAQVAQLQQEALVKEYDNLYEQLLACDHQFAQSIAPTDTQRIIRALAVFRETGISLSQWQRNLISPKLNHHILMYLPANRSELSLRVMQRVERMLASGLCAEVLNLMHKWKLGPEHPAMRAIGYRQISESYADTDKINDQALLSEKINRATMRLVKAQTTWLRRWHKQIELRQDGFLAQGQRASIYASMHQLQASADAYLKA